MSKSSFGNNIVQFDVEGLEEYLENIENMGKNLSEAVIDALQQATKPIYEDILKWAIKHKLTNATLNEVLEIKVEQEGNEFYVELGVSGDNDSWHAVFVEYGRPGFEADPGIARAFKKNKAKSIRIRNNVLKEWGMPSE